MIFGTQDVEGVESWSLQIEINGENAPARFSELDGDVRQRHRAPYAAFE